LKMSSACKKNRWSISGMRTPDYGTSIVRDTTMLDYIITLQCEVPETTFCLPSPSVRFHVGASQVYLQAKMFRTGSKVIIFRGHIES
jgi:hypothetical protein